MAVPIPPITFSIDSLTLGYKGIRNIFGRSGRDNVEPEALSVSVIVPTHNEEEFLEPVIRSLFNQTLRPKNVIVIDGLSTDKTPEICKRLHEEFGRQGFVYGRRDENLGKANNINYALREFAHLLGEIVYINDSDCISNENCIENLTRQFTSHDIAAVTAYAYETPPVSRISRALSYGMDWNNSIFKFRKDAQAYRKAVYVVCGSNTAYRTDILKLFPIPERTQTEDTDYTWFLQERGLRISQAGDALAYAPDLEDPGRLCRRWFRWYSGNIQSFYVHGKDLFKSPSLLFTTIIPGMIEMIPYSAAVISFPIVAGLELSPWTDVPIITNEFIAGFALVDLALTVASAAVFSRKHLLHLPQIYLYKAVASAIVWGALLTTTYEKVTGKQKTWSKAWLRGSDELRTEAEPDGTGEKVVSGFAERLRIGRAEREGVGVMARVSTLLRLPKLVIGRADQERVGEALVARDFDGSGEDAEPVVDGRQEPHKEPIPVALQEYQPIAPAFDSVHTDLLLQRGLRQLRLSAMALNFQQLAQEAGRQKWSYEEYLFHLLELETAQRTENRRIAQAGFPYISTLDQLDFSAAPSIDSATIFELAKGEYLARNENVLFVGNKGTGKTRLAIALGIEACRQGKQVRFFTASGLVSSLLEAQDGRALQKHLTQLQKLDLLIVDDVGLSPLTLEEACLFSLACAPHRNPEGSLLITAELGFDRWREVLGDEELTTALVDGIAHRCHTVEFKGESPHPSRRTPRTTTRQMSPVQNPVRNRARGQRISR